MESQSPRQGGWWAFEIELRPIHVFRTTLETELKMRVGVYKVCISLFDGFGRIVLSAFVRVS